MAKALVDTETMTESMALAICLQMKEDFWFLTKKYDREVHLTPNNYQKYKKNCLHPALFQDRNALNLYNHILRNYEQHVEFLRSKTYG